MIEPYYLTLKTPRERLVYRKGAIVALRAVREAANAHRHVGGVSVEVVDRAIKLFSEREEIEAQLMLTEGA
jgi:hypothetical protein